MLFLRKHRNFLLAAAAFACCLLVFCVFWLLDVRTTRQKSRSIYLNDRQQAVTAPVSPGGSIEQILTSDTPFHALGLLPAFEGAARPGALHLAVYDSTGAQLAAVDGLAAETLPGVYAVFQFPAALHTPDGVYRLVFRAALDDGGDYALAKSSESLPGWQLVENGRPAEGSLCVSVAVDAIGTFVDKFYFAFGVFCCLLLAGLLWLALGPKANGGGGARKSGAPHLAHTHSNKLSFHHLFCVAAAGLGLVYCLVLPPYAAPAEEAAINQSFQLSSALLGAGVPGAPAGSTVRRAADHDVRIELAAPTIFSQREVLRGLFTRMADSTPTAFAGPRAAAPPALQLPAVLGLTLARLLGLGFVPTLLLGRLLGLAAYVLLGTLALAALPQSPGDAGQAAPTASQGLFAAVALLPVSVQLGASFNGLGLGLAGAMLLAALCLRAAQTGAFTLPALAVGAALALCNPYAAPLALLLFATPTLRHKGRIIVRNITYCIYSAICLAALGLAAWQFAGGALAGAAPLLPTNFVKTLLGGVLGSQTLHLNWGFTLAVAVLLALGLVPGPSEAPLPRRVLGFGALAAGLAALGLGAAGAGPLAALPLLALVLTLLCRNWGGIVKTRGTAPFLLVGMAAVSVFSLLDAFLITLTR